jgi:membrane protease subunit HflC
MLAKLLIVLGVLIGLAAIPSSLFTVDRAEFVYLTQFGRRVGIYDGADDAQAGLHVKWPWPIQSIQRLDRRLQYFDLPGAEQLTRDVQGGSVDKTLTIDAYVCWRIPSADAADQFVRSVGTIDRAQLVLGQRIASQLSSAVGEMELSDLIAPDADRIDRKRTELRHRLLDEGEPSLRESALREYGIDVVDVRLRRSNHPVSVREAIFERIKSEREKRATYYKSQGETEAEMIRIDTENKVKKMQREAEVQARRVRNEAEKEANLIRSAAHAKDARFYTFWQDMETYRLIFGDNKTMLLLSGEDDHFRSFRRPPAPEKGAPRKKGA